jgi:hypothetical protein
MMTGGATQAPPPLVADSNMPPLWNETAVTSSDLVRMVTTGDVTALSEAIAQGADVNAIDVQGNRLLHLAVTVSRDSVVVFGLCSI